MRGLIFTSSSNTKLERAKVLGAWQTINYSEVPDWDKAVLELTGCGVDHVLDVGGAATMEKSINALRIGGTLSLVGFLSGLTIPEYDVMSLAFCRKPQQFAAVKSVTAITLSG
ncbi:zinc-binding dehydrogenase [Brevibacillus fluminis]|uniref:zinc-binding dehydrogenase n=1 Tax=Brevibacillus fluminis TaxID=511487 RepID=UPI003F8ADF01